MAASLWLRAYAGAAGIALMGLGADGFFFLPGQGSARSVLRVLVGALLVYAGLGQRDPVVARRFVGGMGVLLLLGTGTTVCFGLLLGGETEVLGPTQASCLVVGFLNVLVARHAEPGVLLAAVFVTSTAVGLVEATEITLRKTPSRARRKIAWGGTMATQARGRRAY